MKWFVLVTAVTFNAVANILIKAGMLGGDKEENIILMLRARWFSPAIIGGVACFGLALVAYSYVLAKMNLSMAYPIMTSAGFAIIATASAILFKETVTPLQIVGFVLMSLGIWFVAR
jgi:small multidrug resistance pump